MPAVRDRVLQRGAVQDATLRGLFHRGDDPRNDPSTQEPEVQRPSPPAAALLALILAAAAAPAPGDPVYKCTKNGRTSFQEKPCDGTVAVRPKPAAAVARLLWESLRGGMTRDEVVRVAGLGDAARKDPQAPLLQRNVTIAGIAFDATYSFDTGGHFASVIAQPAEHTVGSLHMNDNAANLADYRKVVSLLRARYGAPVSEDLKNEDTGFPGLSADTDWQVDGGRLFVALIPITATTSSLHLGFQSAGRGRQ